MAEESVKYYELREIEDHDTEESAWIVIQNNVYDVTKFLEEHPGGAEILLEWAGQHDATDAFEDAGHSNDAREQMKAYKIGELCMADRLAIEVGKKQNQFIDCMNRVQFGLLISTAVFGAGVLIFQLIQKLRK